MKPSICTSLLGAGLTSLKAPHSAVPHHSIHLPSPSTPRAAPSSLPGSSWLGLLRVCPSASLLLSPRPIPYGSSPFCPPSHSPSPSPSPSPFGSTPPPRDEPFSGPPSACPLVYPRPTGEGSASIVGAPVRVLVRVGRPSSKNPTQQSTGARTPPWADSSHICYNRNGSVSIAHDRLSCRGHLSPHSSRPQSCPGTELGCWRQQNRRAHRKEAPWTPTAWTQLCCSVS